MNVQIKTKPRVRLADRNENDTPVWHATRGSLVATGRTAHEAHHNLVYVAPTRRKPIVVR